MSKIRVKWSLKHKNKKTQKTNQTLSKIKIAIGKIINILPKEFVLIKHKLLNLIIKTEIKDDNKLPVFSVDDIKDDINDKEIYISLDEMKEGLKKYIERLRNRPIDYQSKLEKKKNHEQIMQHYTLYNVDKSEQRKRHEAEFQKLTDNTDWEIQEENEWLVEKDEYEKFIRKGDRSLESLKRRLKTYIDTDKSIDSISNDAKTADTISLLRKQIKSLKEGLKLGSITEDAYKKYTKALVDDVAEGIYHNKKLQRTQIDEIKKFIETGDESVLGNVFNYTEPEYKQIYIQQIKERFERAVRAKKAVPVEVKIRKDIIQKARQQAIEKAKDSCRKLGIGKYGSHIQLGDTSRFVTNSKGKIQSFINKSIKQNSVTPYSYQRIVDIDHIFTKDIVKPEITFTTKSGQIRTIPEERITKEEQIEEIRQVNTLENAIIPKAFVKKGIINEYYGAVIAATYFQMLVSNTPIDEEYDFIESRVHYGTSELDLPKTMEDYDEKDIDNQLENNKKIYLIQHHHVPDDEYIRDFWVLHFKGMDFYSKDYASSLFEKKSDKESAFVIADDIYKKTKDLTDKSIAFSAENMNWRYNMLEYGGYQRDGEANVGSQYGFEHGVKNKHSYQAPYGMKRLVDGLWNVLITSGRHYGYVSEFLNSRRNKLDVSKIESRIVKMIVAEYPEIKEVGFSDDIEYVHIMKGD